MGRTGFSAGSGCSNRRLKQRILSALCLRGTLAGTVLNWLRIVVDSAKGGNKNGSALLGLCGTTPGKIINCLGVVADLCYLDAGLVSCWATEARDSGRDGSELASDCRGFCKRWQQKWFPKASQQNKVRKHMQLEGKYNICCGLLRSVSTGLRKRGWLTKWLRSVTWTI